MAGMSFGENKLPVMFVEEAKYQEASANKISDTRVGSEVLFSLGAKSKREVDGMLEKAVAASGTVYQKGHDLDGRMYNGAFVDLDGHRWNMLWMDADKMSKKSRSSDFYSSIY